MVGRRLPFLLGPGIFSGAFAVKLPGGINNLAILQVTFLRRWSLIQWFLYVSFKGGFPTPASGRICHAAALRPAIDQVQGVACWGVTNVGVVRWVGVKRHIPRPFPQKMGGREGVYEKKHLENWRKSFQVKKNIIKILARIPPKIKWRVFLPLNIFGLDIQHLEMAWDWDFWRCVCLHFLKVRSPGKLYVEATSTMASWKLYGIFD